jgi:hypothetical protein
MPDDAKSIIHETIHEVCERIIANPVAHSPSPHITLPVPVPVENVSPIFEALSITPGIQSMFLMISAALSALQAMAPSNGAILPTT